MIKSSHDLLELPVGYILKTAAFGKVFPDQAMGVFIQPTLPGMIGMCNMFSPTIKWAELVIYNVVLN